MKQRFFNISAITSMHRRADGGIQLRDESLGIDSKIPVAEAILSEKDLKHPLLKDYDSPFDYTINLYE